MMWRNQKVLLTPLYGSLGLVGYPYFLFVELLGPVVEALGLVVLVISIAMGAIDVSFAIMFFLVAYGYGLCLALCSIALEEFGEESLRQVLRVLRRLSKFQTEIFIDWFPVCSKEKIQSAAGYSISK